MHHYYTIIIVSLEVILEKKTPCCLNTVRNPSVLSL